MTTQHTTGPWRLSSGDETEIFSGAKPVARAHCGGLTSVKLPEAEANARLIAAAPDLLALAYDFGQMLTGMDPYTFDDASIMRDKIKAIIARATGAAQ